MKNITKNIKKILNFDRGFNKVTNLAWQNQRDLIDNIKPVIFDVGANVGDITYLYRQLFPEAIIHTFEPTPSLYSLLCHRNDTDFRVICNQLAIADDERLSIFNINKSLATNSLHLSHPAANELWGENLLDIQDQIEVTVTTIDQYCKLNSIEHIDIVKLDIQGSEYDALIGAKNMLKDQKISLVYTEIILADTYVDQKKLHEYLELMDGFGYIVFNIYNPKIRQQQIAQADFLFVTPHILSSFRKKQRKSYIQGG